MIDANLHRLPTFVMDDLTSEEFAVKAAARFLEADSDGNGVLTPDEVFPVIEQLLGVHPWAITIDHCFFWVGGCV